MPEVPVGGAWSRCYEGFRLSGDPHKDVTRLALLCGPSTGMRRVGADTTEGSVRADGPAATAEVPARRGDCYRIFAVAEPAVTDLDVTVHSSHGVTIAGDHGEGSWPIVHADRPFCALADDTWTVEVAARRGAGRFAMEVWRLSPPGRDDGPN